jgi:hypothetical protein
MLLGFGGLALLCLLAVSWLSVTQLSRAVHDTPAADAQGWADDVAGTIERMVLERRREVEFLGMASDLRNTRSAPDQARLFLRRAQETSPRYAMIGFIDLSGRVLVTSNGLVEGVDVSTRDYFKSGKQDLFVSDAHDAILLAKTLGSPDYLPRFVDLAAPVRDGDTVIGVVAAHLAVEWVADLGSVITKRLRNHNVTARLEVRGADGSIIYASGEHSPSPEADAQPGANDAQVGRAYINGIGPGGSLHWLVTVTFSGSDSATRLQKFSRALLIGVVAIGAYALLLGWMLARIIARPIEGLSTRILGAADRRSVRPAGLSLREANDIAASVNLIVEELQAERSNA